MHQSNPLFKRVIMIGSVLLALLLVVFLVHYAGASVGNPQPAAQSNVAQATSPVNNPGATSYQHIFLIVMENVGYSSVIGNSNTPWINATARHAIVATHYYGVAHPSQPNYLALTSGSTQGVNTDANVTIHARNLVDQLEAHNKTWKAYMQSLLSHGNTTKLAASVGDYARKHDPFVSYADIAQNPARMAKIVDFSQFATDLAHQNIPDFAWITPDLCHDMHGRVALSPNDPCGDEQALLRLGDTFLRTTVTEIMHSAAWNENALILITWDENDTSLSNTSGCCSANPGGGHVLTLALASKLTQPRTLTTPANHYSLLATLENTWQLGCLGAACETRQVQPLHELLP